MQNVVGIVGLGRVGIPVAQAYLAAGYRVVGYDVRAEAMDEFAAFGGAPQPTPADVARMARDVLVLVLNDDQVIDAVAASTGVLAGSTGETRIVCMSTIKRSTVELLAEQCRERGAALVDCPFTGGPVRVPTGTLTLIAAASAPLLAAVTPLLNVIGNVIRAGEHPGCGQSIKHCNQLLVAATHAATMEVITLARRQGLDPSVVCQVLTSGIAGSDYFHLLSESVLNGTPSPGGLGQMCKDVAIVANAARESKMPALVFTAASQYFLVAESLGMQSKEGADLIAVVEHVSGSAARPTNSDDEAPS